MQKKKRMLWWISGGAVLLAALIGILFWAFGNDNRPIVEVDKVQQVNRLTALVTASGEIKPKNYVDLQSEITGVIEELLVKEGDPVTKGQVLLKIDPLQTEAEKRAAEFQLRSSEDDAANTKHRIAEAELMVRISEANLQTSYAELEQAKANLENEESLFKRRQQLHEENLISREEYDQAKSSLRVMQSRLTAAQSRIEELKTRIEVSKISIQQMKSNYESSLNRIGQYRAMLDRANDLLEKTVLVSPLTGIITKLEVEKGERAVPGTLNNPSATLMTIADLSVIEAEVKVDETDIINVKLNQEVTVKVDALPDQPLKGHVTEIGNSAITAGQAIGGTEEAKDFKVVIQLDNPPGLLRPGVSATADINTATKGGVLAIPLQALVMREVELDPLGQLVHEWQKKPGDKKKEAAKKDEKPLEKQGVFRVDKDNRAIFTLVETGITGETNIEVLKGLKEGEEIAVGTFKVLRNLKDGDFVKKKKAGDRDKKDEEQADEQ